MRVVLVRMNQNPDRILSAPKDCYRKTYNDFCLQSQTYNFRAQLLLYDEAVQSYLKKLGFDIKINTVDDNLIDNMGIKSALEARQRYFHDNRKTIRRIYSDTH